MPRTNDSSEGFIGPHGLELLPVRVECKGEQQVSQQEEQVVEASVVVGASRDLIQEELVCNDIRNRRSSEKHPPSRECPSEEDRQTQDCDREQREVKDWIGQVGDRVKEW